MPAVRGTKANGPRPDDEEWEYIEDPKAQVEETIGQDENKLLVTIAIRRP